MVKLNSPFGNISLNETTGEIESNVKGFYYLALFTSLNVIISAFCLIYIVLKLTINKFIRDIFSIVAIQNIVCSTTMTICAVIMICLNERPSWTCQGLVIANFVLLRTQSVMIPLISVLRYAMASKAMSSKMIQKKYLTFVIIFSILFPYFNACINLMLNGGYSKLTYLCMEVPLNDYEIPKLPFIFNATLYLLLLGSGIFFDYQMILFVKNRNQIQPIQLVPWKIIGSEEKEKDMEVPLRTTIISSFMMLSFFIGFLLYLALDHFWPIPFIVTGYCIIILPLSLFFSVKHTKNKKAKVQRPSLQPPQGPHFHDESSSFHNGISYPLQFHEDFETIEGIKEAEVPNMLQPHDNFEMIVEDIEGKILNDRNVIVHT